MLPASFSVPWSHRPRTRGSNPTPQRSWKLPCSGSLSPFQPSLRATTACVSLECRFANTSSPIRTFQSFSIAHEVRSTLPKWNTRPIFFPPGLTSSPPANSTAEPQHAVFYFLNTTHQCTHAFTPVSVIPLCPGHPSSTLLFFLIPRDPPHRHSS